MRLAVFDIDGTLTRTTRIDEACFVRALEAEFGITDPETDWSRYRAVTDIGIAGEILERKFGREAREGEVARVRDRYMTLLESAYAERPEEFEEVNGAASAFSDLRIAPGWGVAVATGCWRVSAHFKAARIGLDLGEVPTAFAEDASSRRGILETAIRRAGSVDRAVYFGDGVWDVRAAREAGVAFIGVGGDGRLAGEGARHVIPDFTDLDRLRTCLQEAVVPEESR